VEETETVLGNENFVTWHSRLWRYLQ